MTKSEKRMANSIYEKVEITDAGSEGKAIARIGNLVVFVPFVVPGDIADIQIIKKKKSYLEGRVVRFHKYAAKRAVPFCSHFGTCGGCRWQNMRYVDQLYYKQKQVTDNFTRIAKIEDPVILPILPSENTTYYRNKLEYTFSNRRWLTGDDLNKEPSLRNQNALGFHIPLLFDKILDIDHCYLQPDPSNAIRLEARRYALEHNLTFYDARTWKGFMRNLIIRNSNTGGLMVIFVFRDDEQEVIQSLLDHFRRKFPQITSLYFVINPKKNDVISDLPAHLYSGEAFITEKMNAFDSLKELQFRIGPVSFYQTNSGQAGHLYRIAAEFAGFKGSETVFDLYTGTGTIANYIAGAVGKVTGIESVAEAVRDAEENSRINEIINTDFFTGEAEKVLTDDFIALRGKPDVIITDPPRAGMHGKVVNAMLKTAPEKIIYISCNPATQARDIALMKEYYNLEKCQPVDMFPHTQHLENIALLLKKGS
jgi:23S rRNA (uracil1939-C5)-methyltransferase